MKRICSLMMSMLMILCLFTACSSDDEPGNNEGISIDGASVVIDEADITYNKVLEDSQGDFVIPEHASCTAYLYFDDFLYRFNFSIYGVSTEREMVKGKNVIDDLSVLAFHPISSIELATRYGEEAGSVIVKEVAHGYVVLEFKNFSFEKDNNGRKHTYHINGCIKYNDINVD